MIDSLGIRAKLSAGFVLFAAALVGIGVVGVVLLNETAAEQRDRLLMADTVAQGAETLKFQLTAMSDAMRGILLEPSDDAERTHKENADHGFDEATAFLKKAVAGWPTLTAAVEKIDDFDDKSVNPSRIRSSTWPSPTKRPRSRSIGNNIFRFTCVNGLWRSIWPNKPSRSGPGNSTRMPN